MEKRNNLIINICTISVLLIIFLIGTFFDLEISRAICALDSGEYFTSSFILILSEIFGETVLYGLVSFAVLMLYLSDASVFKCNKNTKKVIKFFCIVILFGINVFATFKVIGYFSDHYFILEDSLSLLSIVCYLLGGCVFSLIWYLIAKKVPAEICKSLAIWSLIVALTVILSQIVVQGAKPIFNRVRFRTMNFLEDYSYFSKWFSVKSQTFDTFEYLKILVGSDGYKSFPSGHTACGASLITLTLIPEYCVKLQSKCIKILLNIFAYSYCALLGLSRILVGAHFLTDVVFSIIVTFSASYFSKYVIDKIFKRKTYGKTFEVKEVSLEE